MLHSKTNAIALISLVTVISIFSVKGQSTPTPTCQTVSGMSAVNASLFTGDWYEEFRVPAKNISCLKVNVNTINNQTQLKIITSYSASKSGLLMDKHYEAKIDMKQVNANTGFNVSYSNTKVNTTIKILSTDYNSNVVLCGYTNVSDPATSFYVILSRIQIVNSTWLMDLKVSASKIVQDFNSSTGTNITQSKSCHKSSAATSVPALTALFAAFYALLKLAY